MSYWQVVDRPVRKLPRAPGVYVIYKAGFKPYVGSAVNLQERFFLHSKKDLDRVKYKLSKKLGDWLMLEYRLATRLKRKLRNRFEYRVPRKEEAKGELSIEVQKQELVRYIVKEIKELEETKAHPDNITERFKLVLAQKRADSLRKSQRQVET